MTKPKQLFFTLSALVLCLASFAQADRLGQDILYEVQTSGQFGKGEHPIARNNADF